MELRICQHNGCWEVQGRPADKNQWRMILLCSNQKQAEYFHDSMRGHEREANRLYKANVENKR